MTTPGVNESKDFDCVDMKQRIQAELAEAQAGWSREALNAAAVKRLAADPHLKRLVVSSAAPPSSSSRRAG